MSLAWFKECRAALDSIAANPLRERYGIENAAHRSELLDKLAEVNPALLLGIGDTLQLGRPTMATSAVIGALADLRGDMPWLFVGEPLRADLVKLEVHDRYRGSCTADQLAYVTAEVDRALCEVRRRRLWQLLRARTERGEEWPDLGSDWAYPKIVLPKFTVIPTAPRVDRAPPPAPTRSRHGFRAMHR